jgi:hypothetical protein
MTNKSLIFAGIFAAILGNNAFATGENTVTSKSYVDAMDATKQDKVTAGTTGSVVTYNGTQNGQTQFSERGIFDYNTSGEWDDNDNSWWGIYNVANGHGGDIITAETYTDDINYMGETFSNMQGDTGTVVVRGDDGMPTESRNIYDGLATYNESTDADSLITAGAVQGQIDASVTNVNNQITDVNDQITNVNNQITNINNQLNAQTLEPIGVSSLTCANQECTLYQVTTNAGIAHRLHSCTTATVATDCPTCGTGTKAACEYNICKCNLCKVDGTRVSNPSECCSGNATGGMICCGTSGGMNCGDR